MKTRFATTILAGLLALPLAAAPGDEVDMEKMHQQMMRSQQVLEQARKARDPKTHDQLMEQHMQEMMKGMGMMRHMMGHMMGGGMMGGHDGRRHDGRRQGGYGARHAR